MKKGEILFISIGMAILGLGVLTTLYYKKAGIVVSLVGLIILVVGQTIRARRLDNQ